MLQLDAETNVGTYNIYLGVKGTVDHMDLTLKSEPSLSRKANHFYVDLWSW